MQVKLQKHNMEGAFVLLLFAVFAIAIVSVLALGAKSYKGIVERDNQSYNKRIITSYVTAKIRNNDINSSIKIGGFSDSDKEDGIHTLHMYQNIEGEEYDLRIYFYKNYVYELLTLKDNVIEPEAGNPVMEAKGLSFTKNKSVVTIHSIDADNLSDTATAALRSEGGETS